MDAQATILKKLMQDPTSRKAFSVLQEEHFASKAFRYVYRQLKETLAQDGPVTFKVLQDHVARQSIPDKAKKFIFKVMGEIVAAEAPLSSEFEYAIRSLVEDARVECYYTGIQRVANALSRGAIQEAEDLLTRLPDEASKLKVTSTRRISARSMQTLEAKPDTDRFPVGFDVFDQLTGGGRLGEFWLWAAYTAEFKSTALLAIAHTNFLKGKNVLFVSLEMDEDEVRGRLLCRHGIHLEKFVKYAEVFDLEHAADVKIDFDTNMTYGDIEIWQPPLGVTIVDVAREYEEACTKKEYDLLIVDYIQKLAPMRSRFKIREELNETLDASKRLAMEARSRKGVWLISGYQTSSDGRKQAEKQGYYDLWALSETIAAGQVANVVCWSLQTEKMRGHKEVKVGLAKSRNSSIAKSQHFLLADPEVGLLSCSPIEEGISQEEQAEDFLEGVVDG